MEKTNSDKGNFFEMIMGIVVWVDIAIFMINTIESKFYTGLCLIALAFVSFIIYRSWKRTRQKSNDYTSNYVKETSAHQESTVSSDTDNSSATESTQVKELTEIAQMNLFTGFDPQRKVKEYTQVYPLCLTAFANLLVSPYNEDILETYVSKWGIPDEYASSILELPNAKKLITVNKEKLPTSAVLKMYTLPNAVELFEAYINVEEHNLRIVEKFAMLEQPNAAELVAVFTKGYYVCKVMVKVMFKLPDAAKFAKILIRNEGYEDGGEFADVILASPYATELVKIFDANGGKFDEKQQEKLFELDVREVQMKYLLDPDVCEEVENATFTSPYAEELLARIIEEEEHEFVYASSEVLMCQMPDAENFVTAYTKYAELDEGAKAYAQAKGLLPL